MVLFYPVTGPGCAPRVTVTRCGRACTTRWAGTSAFLRLAAAHHARCLADPVLEHPFSHGVRVDHVERLAAYWAEVLGGPPRFSEAPDGGQTALLYVHSGNGAEAGLGDLFMGCFLAAMDDTGLPADPEVRAVLEAYMVWAVEEFMHYAPYGTTVADGLAVPRWSWDGLVEGP